MKTVTFLIAFLLAASGCSLHDERPQISREQAEWNIWESGSGAQFRQVEIFTVKGHGRTCYVFSRSISASNSAAVLWCEGNEGKQ